MVDGAVSETNKHVSVFNVNGSDEVVEADRILDAHWSAIRYNDVAIFAS